MKDTRRKILWFFGVLGVLCPCTICGGGYFLFRSWFSGPAASLPGEVAKARQAGIPVEPSDLRPHPPIPDEQNAATVYLAFFPRVEKTFKDNKDLRKQCANIVDGKATDEERRALAAIVEQSPVRETLVEFGAASKRPFCDFHYRYEEGFSLLFPEFARSKDAARLLCAKAQLLLDRGKVAESLDTIATAQRLAVHIGQTPVLIAALVDLSLEAMVQNEFANILAKCSASSSLLARAQKVLDGFGPLVSLRNGFGGEVVMGRIGIEKLHTTADVKAISQDQPDTDGTEGGPPRKEGTPIPDTIIKGSEAKFVHYWRAVFAGLPSDPSNWEAARASMKTVQDQLDADNSPSNYLNRIIFPTFFEAADAIGRQQANRNVAATSIRLMQDHLRTGVYPKALPNYGPISIDPFDHKPLKYRREVSGFTIYSIDRDREDNGGRKRRAQQKGDLVRTYP